MTSFAKEIQVQKLYHCEAKKIVKYKVNTLKDAFWHWGK